MADGARDGSGKESGESQRLNGTLPRYVQLVGQGDAAHDGAACCECGGGEGGGGPGERAGRRLLIALLMFLGLGAIGTVLALAFGIVVPPMLWAACVVLLVVGVIAGGTDDEHRARRSRLGDGDGARAVGCCPGPRALGTIRRD